MEINIGNLIIDEEINIGNLEINAIKEYPELEDLVVIPKGIDQNFVSNKYGYKNVKVNAIRLQDKKMTLNKNGIYTIKSDDEFSGLNKVEITLDAIEDLDNELNAYNEELIKQELKIDEILECLKGKGIIEPRELNVTPTNEPQTINGVYNKVNIIGDEDLKPENIKLGINVFGVDGTMEADDFVIEDVAYLFYGSTRYQKYNEFLKHIPEDISTLSNFFYGINSEAKAQYIDLKTLSKFKNLKTVESIMQSASGFIEIDLTSLDISNCGSIRQLCRECFGAKKINLKGLVHNKITTIQNFVYGCRALTELDVSEWDTSGVIDSYAVFYGLENIETLDLGAWNMEKLSNFGQNFINCSKLTNLTFFSNYGKGFNTNSSANSSFYTLDLSKCPLLNHDSLMDVINKLYDLYLTYENAYGGYKTQQLVLGANNIAKMTSEELDIAVQKGWVVS